MNCKQGDIAVVVSDDDSRNVGVFVHVLAWVGAYRFQNGELRSDVWRVETLTRAWDSGGKLRPTGDIGNACDSVLRPIRDPGEDARDETLGWLPVPKPETEPA